MTESHIARREGPMGSQRRVLVALTLVLLGTTLLREAEGLDDLWSGTLEVVLTYAALFVAVVWFAARPGGGLRRPRHPAPRPRGSGHGPGPGGGDDGHHRWQPHRCVRRPAPSNGGPRQPARAGVQTSAHPHR